MTKKSKHSVQQNFKSIYNLCRSSTPKEMAHDSPLLRVGFPPHSFHGAQPGEPGGVASQWRSLADTETRGGWSRRGRVGGGVDAARVSRVHGAPLCCDVIRAAPHPGGLSPENPYPESKHEKNITQVQVEGPSTKHLRVLLEAVRAVTNSGRGRHRPARRDPQRRGH